MKVYIHSQNQFLDLPGRVGHKVYINDKMQSQIGYQEVTQQEKIKIREDDTGKMKIKTCSYLNFDKCMYRALATAMRNETIDNCTTPYILDNEKICTKREDIKTSFLIAVRRSSNEGRDCDLPCRSLFIGVGGKNLRKYKKRGYGEFTAYFRPRVYTIKEHYLYSFIHFIAEVGKTYDTFLTTIIQLRIILNIKL